jgi:hypothetical protein
MGYGERRECQRCGRGFEPRGEQRFCSASCAYQFKLAAAKSARRMWVAGGRSLQFDDGLDLRRKADRELAKGWVA